MVARAHRRATTLTELRDLIEVGRDGVSAHTLVETAPALGMKARAISLAADRIASLPLPTICLWENDHFVVVHRVGRRAVHVLDPARGRRRLGHDDFAASCRQVA
jgi:ABC-type bacteriocin/lantibiotic exporter with double-glycine peptidase domain